MEILASSFLQATQPVSQWDTEALKMTNYWYQIHGNIQ